MITVNAKNVVSVVSLFGTLQLFKFENNGSQCLFVGNYVYKVFISIIYAFV